MKELDLLKKNWQNTNAFKQVSEDEIYKMIHKKSSSIVKWILVVSVLELFFWNIISFAFLGDGYIKQKYGMAIAAYVIEINNVYNIINYIVVAVFIYLFYKNYKEICVTSSTKILMQKILKTKKTVNSYIWFNLLFFIFGTLIILFVQFKYDPKYQLFIEKVERESTMLPFLKAIGYIILSLSFFVLLFWLFYKLLYGLLLKKLNRNYNELKKMDL